MNLKSQRLEIQLHEIIFQLNLESLRLEIQLNRHTLLFQVTLTVAIHYFKVYLSSITLLPKNRASSTLTHTLSSLTLTPLTLTHHIASLTAFPSQQFHISGKGFLN